MSRSSWTLQASTRASSSVTPREELSLKCWQFGLRIAFPGCCSHRRGASLAHDAAFEIGGAVDVEITIARINAILQADLSLVTDRIDVPTVVVAARDDCLIPQYMSDVVAQRIPGSKYIVLDQGGHFLPETRSRDYNTLLDDFLGSLNLQTPAECRQRRSAS